MAHTITKVYLLAKELGVASKAILTKCDAEGMELKGGHMTPLTSGQAATIREWFREGSHAIAGEASGPVDLGAVQVKLSGNNEGAHVSSVTQLSEGSGEISINLDRYDDVARYKQSHDVFINYINHSHGWPKEYIDDSEKEKIKTLQAVRVYIRDPKSKIAHIIAILSYKKSKDLLKRYEEYSRGTLEVAKSNDLKRYIVFPTQPNSQEPFEIYSVPLKGEAIRIDLRDFPYYEEMNEKSIENIFHDFLIKKGWTENYIHKDIEIPIDPGIFDLYIREPKSVSFIYLVEFKTQKSKETISQIRIKMQHAFKESYFIDNKGFIVFPTQSNNTKEQFEIYSVPLEGQAVRIDLDGFPCYEERTENADNKQEDRDLKYYAQYFEDKGSLSSITRIARQIAFLKKDLIIKAESLIQAIAIQGVIVKARNASYFLYKNILNPKVIGDLRQQLESLTSNQIKYAEEVSSLSKDVVNIFDKTKDISEKTSKDKKISGRHLLGGLLVYSCTSEGEGVYQSLMGMGIDPIAAKKEYITYMKKETDIFLEGPDFFPDSSEEWRKILLGHSPEDSKDGKNTVSPLRMSIPLVNNDMPRDINNILIDRLSIETEVNAISALVAAKEARPPISIGLFGDWGTGKSFFMEMMQDRIGQIQKQSKNWCEKGNESAFCTHIVQIRFNAWHYMDANLWASLVCHIFDELAKAINPINIESSKKELINNIKSAKEELAKAKEKEKEAKERKQEAESKYEYLKEEKEKEADKLKILKASDIIQLAKNDTRIRESCRDIAEKMGLRIDNPDVEEIRALVNETRTLSDKIIHIFKMFPSQKNGKLKMVSIIVALLFISGVFIYAATWDGLWQKIGGYILAIIGYATLFAKELRPKIKLINDGLDRWGKLQEQIQNIANQKNREEIELEQHLRKLVLEVNQAQKEVECARVHLDKAEKELNDIEIGRQLYRFIEEKSQRVEYKQQLGVINTIREDFSHLSDLIARSSQDQSKSADSITRIDRIILYIDDLDRCPSRRVVEVLQAVHLLLAFPLFVVVVGVDARWVLHALREEYTAFGSNDDKLDQRWLTTPQNYVEKIFQIPFALRPMETSGFESLVDGLIQNASQQVDSARSIKDSVSERTQGNFDTGKDIDNQKQNVNNVSREGAKSQDAVDIEDIETKKVSEEKNNNYDKKNHRSIDMQPPTLEIQEKEIIFMKLLGEMIPSPRAAKRFVNIYRLIRATINDEKTLRRFTGTEIEPGEYQAVQVMLAILTGFPDLAGNILRVMARGAQGISSFNDFINAMQTKIVNDSKPIYISNHFKKNISEEEQPQWEKLYNILQGRYKENSISDSIVPYMVWAELILRFSFQYGQNKVTSDAQKIIVNGIRAIEEELGNK